MPTHLARSSGEARKSPRWPEVPVDRPAECPRHVAVKSRERSASSTSGSSVESRAPTVLIASKLAIHSRLPITGHSANGLEA